MKNMKFLHLSAQYPVTAWFLKAARTDKHAHATESWLGGVERREKKKNGVGYDSDSRKWVKNN